MSCGYEVSKELWFLMAKQFNKLTSFSPSNKEIEKNVIFASITIETGVKAKGVVLTVDDGDEEFLAGTAPSINPNQWRRLRVFAGVATDRVEFLTRAGYMLRPDKVKDNFAWVVDEGAKSSIMESAYIHSC